MKKKYLVMTIFSLIVSVISGIISNDLIIEESILLTGLLCAYFASEGTGIYFNNLDYNCNKWWKWISNDVTCINWLPINKYLWTHKVEYGSKT